MKKIEEVLIAKINKSATYIVTKTDDSIYPDVFITTGQELIEDFKEEYSFEEWKDDQKADGAPTSIKEFLSFVNDQNAENEQRDSGSR